MNQTKALWGHNLLRDNLATPSRDEPLAHRIADTLGRLDDVDLSTYSKTPESFQVDHPFREAGTRVFGPFVIEIPMLLFEYEYRFTEYECEKNQWYELPATITPDGP